MTSSAGYEINDVIPPAEPSTPATNPAPRSKITFASEITTPSTLPYEHWRYRCRCLARHTVRVDESADTNVLIRELSLEESLFIRDARRPAVGWAPDFPTKEDVRVATYARYMPASSPEPWTSPWLVIERDLVVGMLGFKGEPVVDLLEVGYGIVPSVRGRGVATKALSQLLDQVKHRGIKVRAETYVWNGPSQAVLRRLHFNEVGRRRDADDGELIVWEILVD